MRKATLLLLLVIVLSISVMAETAPKTFSYQGVLTDDGGTLLNGTFDIIARIYDDSIGGNLLDELPFSAVLVQDGIFNLNFADVSGLGPSTDPVEFHNGAELNRYLELNIEGETVLPRSRLFSSPYSMISRGLAGDIFTSPGHLYMVPDPNPVSDCTSVPFELAVDSDITRLRMRPYNWDSDCTYVPLEMRVDASSSHFHMYPSELVTPADSVEPAIVMNVDPTSAIFNVFGVEPEPFRADHGDPAFSVQADETQTTMSVRHAFADPDIEPAIAANVNPTQSIFWVMGVDPQPFITGSMAPSFAVESNDRETSMLIHHQSVDGLGDADAAYMTMSSAPTTGASMLMFNPQPDPPGNPALLMSINGGPSTGASMLMFNPQPDPPEDPSLQLHGGLGDSGPGIFMFNPQPEPPGTPPFLLGMQTTPSGAMFDLQSEPGFAKAAGGPSTSVSISADTGASSIDVTATINVVGIGDQTGNVKINAAPGGEKAIIVVDTQPGERIMNAKFGTGIGGGGDEVGIIIIDSKPGEGKTSSLSVGSNLGGAEEVGIIIIDSKPVGASANTASVNLKSDANVGSSLQMDYEFGAGINPCTRVFSEAAGAGMNIYGTNPPDDGKSGQVKNVGPRTADSAVINLFADTGKATIELFGALAGDDASIVMISDNSGGSIGINTNSPAETLHVVGNICATGTIGACSDERYKKDIETIDDALQLINQLRGVNFNWRTEEFPENNFSEKEQVGFIAQEIQKVLPEVVSKGDDGYYSVDYAKLTPVLVEAVKAQQKTIDEVKTQNIELAKELSELKKMVQALAVAQSNEKSSELAVADLK